MFQKMKMYRNLRNTFSMEATQFNTVENAIKLTFKYFRKGKLTIFIGIYFILDKSNLM